MFNMRAQTTASHAQGAGFEERSNSGSICRQSLT